MCTTLASSPGQLFLHPEVVLLLGGGGEQVLNGPGWDHGSRAATGRKLYSLGALFKGLDCVFVAEKVFRAAFDF